MNASLRPLATVVVGVFALWLVVVARDCAQPGEGRLRTADGDSVEITDAARAGTLRFGTDVASADRAWIAAAVARARPEAARLIAEVDGLVPAVVNDALDAQIPRGGPCGLAIDCEMPEERFADTFAKWALNGAVSEVGAGYGIAMPASIEDWGAPLA